MYKLPKIEHPTFHETLPVSKTPISFRPLLVKEEKILLIAKESNDRHEVGRVVNQILMNCLVTPEDMNVAKLSTTDAEFFFLKLRARSVNNIIELRIKDEYIDKHIEVSVDIDKDVSVSSFVEGSDIITIDKNISMKLRLPTLEMLSLVDPEDPYNTENSDKLFRACIEFIFDKDEIYSVDQIDAEELNTFLDDLPLEAERKINEFFETLPQLSCKISYLNSKQEQRELTVKGLSSFFLLG